MIVFFLRKEVVFTYHVNADQKKINTMILFIVPFLCWLIFFSYVVWVFNQNWLSSWLAASKTLVFFSLPFWILFCFISWKPVSFLGSKDGSKFWWLLWFLVQNKDVPISRLHKLINYYLLRVVNPLQPRRKLHSLSLR